ncbi:MAG: hypothetical protein J7484_02375 [Microbacterium sp.]|nr:hypothetical protein [Microbacterium sp.]
MAGTLGAAILLVAAEIAVAGWSTAAPALRTAIQIVIAVLVVVALLAAAFFLPLYRIVPIAAQHVRAGALLVTSPHPLLAQACTVTSTFVFHGEARTETWLGMVDGSDVEVDIATVVHVAEPRDRFARLRARPEEGRRAPAQPSESALGVLAAIWDVRLRLRHDDVLVEEVSAELGAQPTTEYDELLELRLIRQSRRGIGRGQRTYVSLRPAGMITLAAVLRERDIEIYNDAGKEVPVVINNSGIIMSGSPGGIANLGSGSIHVMVAPDVYDALTALATAASALSTRVDEPDTATRLADAADDLQHELDHPQHSAQRLKRFTRSIIDIGGSGVAALIGNAAWGTLAVWLGLTGNG